MAEIIILAIPAGGVPVGAVIAKRLVFPMDMIIVRKLPIPHNPEAGFGSISWETIQLAVADAYQEWHDLTDQEVILIINEILQR